MAANGYFITATDTGIGKTVVTAALLTLFRQHGQNAGFIKPIETGVDTHCSSAANSDAKFLLECSGLNEPLEAICPLILKTPAAPYQAAEVENREIDPAAIEDACRALASRYHPLLVEGVGGLRVPITPDYHVIDLIAALGFPVILVSGFQLGTLNHTLLSLDALHARGIPVKGVIFSDRKEDGLTDVEALQPALISHLSKVPVLGRLPFIDDLSTDSFTPEVCAHLEQMINLPALLDG
ncbi:dethiobiotin synthase [Nitrospina sp. 32_T5]|uniref:dethiobiotin synthase n=1 Tax=unclassified Nitrospina TaxID=2638683 RepID=UPI003F99DE69